MDNFHLNIYNINKENNNFKSKLNLTKEKSR